MGGGGTETVCGRWKGGEVEERRWDKATNNEMEWIMDAVAFIHDHSSRMRTRHARKCCLLVSRKWGTSVSRSKAGLVLEFSGLDFSCFPESERRGSRDQMNLASTSTEKFRDRCARSEGK